MVCPHKLEPAPAPNPRLWKNVEFERETISRSHSGQQMGSINRASMNGVWVMGLIEGLVAFGDETNRVVLFVGVGVPDYRSDHHAGADNLFHGFGDNSRLLRI